MIPARQFLALTPERRALAFEQAATQRAVGPVCDVIALELGRSFWEKATILHAEFHRAANEPMPDRYARHYADVARLLEHSEAGVFLADRVLCARVADWKSRVFAKASARYDLARHGTFRLVPPAFRQPELAQDYAIMGPMYLREPPPFEQVMEKLVAAERIVNAS